jgi:mannose-1-phosphate guanylyltransferase
MILCAGVGTRMRPLSDHWAKPSLPILDEPLVLKLVQTLAEQGVDAVIVNTHAHTESLLAALAAAPISVEVSRESRLLGSGGGIRRAQSFLERSEPFAVLNGDMCLDLDLLALVEAHRDGGATTTLALRDDERKRSFGSIGYDGTRAVRRVTDRLDLGGELGSGLFAGVHVMNPDVFEWMPEREEFEILADVYIPALGRGERIHSWLQPQDCEWSPVGDPGELLSANLQTLGKIARESEEKRVFVADSARVEGRLEAPVWVGERAEIARGANVGPWAVIGAEALVAAGTRAERALFLPGARPPAGAQLSSAIAFAGEIWRGA